MRPVTESLSAPDASSEALADCERAARLAAPFVPRAGRAALGFARVRSSAGTERDLLLGAATHIEPELALIDWRTAPLAEIFFAYEEGEEYAIEVDGRTVEGVLLRRALLSFEDGALSAIFLGGREWIREAGAEPRARADAAAEPRPREPQSPPRGQLSLFEAPRREATEATKSVNSVNLTKSVDPVQLTGSATPVNAGFRPGWRPSGRDRLGPPLLPRPPALRGRTSSVADAELDSIQRAAVALPASKPLLLLGEAGCGKTTVALHRVARLEKLRGRMNSAVVVPTEGLRVLTELLLERLGVSGAQVFRFDRFAAEQARRAFPDLPKKESENATGATIKLKRHPAVRAALRELAQLPITLPPEGAKVRKSRAFARREDLHALFGDSKFVQQILAGSGGELGAASARDVLEHARIQFSDGAEKEFAHVDLEARQTADGRGLDEGTPMEDAGSVDAEDYAVLFELERLRAARMGRKPTQPKQYDCVVLDEAQELSPLELALVGRSVNAGGTLIVAGDADQQVDAGALFLGWAESMRELGAPLHEKVVLSVNYRCPPEVTAFARTLRAEPQRERAPSLLPQSESALAPPALLGSELHVALWLIGALQALRDSDPSASVAIISRSAELATRLLRPLSFTLAVQLSLGGRFSFAPGIQLTCVDEVKGLEFDHVVVPDATAQIYPDTPASRRALYVAATRPRHQLLLAGARELSSLVQPR